MDQRDLEAQFEHNRADFILIEVESGLTFARLGLETQEKDTRQRNLNNARKAYDTAQKFLQEKPVEDGTVHAKIATGLDTLKDYLIQLAEKVS